nr:MAG TPA: hypothetical protein [Caudoviricetes sp.]
MNNRKAKMLFIERHEIFRVSNRKWLIIYNRAGDMVLHRHRRSAAQNRWKNHAVRNGGE